MDENHDKIYEKLGKLGGGIAFLVADAKKKNGYITDLNKRVTDTEKANIILEERWEKFLSRVSNGLGEINIFLRDQKEEKLRKRNMGDFIKENYLLFVLTISTSWIVGNFTPNIWPYIKHFVGL